MKTMLRGIALAAAAAGVAMTSPAAAFDAGVPGYSSQSEQTWEYRGRDHRGKDRRHKDRNRYYGKSSYSEPLRRDSRVWRGNDGRYYCQKKDGTTGLIIGGAVGALLGREIDKHGDRTLGTVLGAAGGAFLGNEVAKGRSCR